MAGAVIPLSEATNGSTLRISGIEVQGVLRRRLLDLGFVTGNRVEVLRRSRSATLRLTGLAIRPLPCGGKRVPSFTAN